MKKRVQQYCRIWLGIFVNLRGNEPYFIGFEIEKLLSQHFMGDCRFTLASLILIKIAV